MNYLLIALGGAFGSVLRVWLSSTVQYRLHWGFPIGTMSVNILGSLLAGFCYAIFYQRFAGNEFLRAFIIFGILGGFTTFSAFSLETVNLIHSGFWLKALLNIIVSVLTCVVAAAAGLQIGRLIAAS